MTNPFTGRSGYNQGRGGSFYSPAETSQIRLRRLSKARRMRIADISGCSHSDASSLVDHLSRREVARYLLEKISPEGLTAVRVFIEASDLLPRIIAEKEIERRLGSDGTLALKEIDELGIMLTSKWAGGAELIGLIPPLPRSMRHFLWLLCNEKTPDALTLTDPPAKASIKLPDIRLLVLALATVAAAPPRLARDKTIHTSDLSRIFRDRLSSCISDLEEYDYLVNHLLALGLLNEDDEGRARVLWKRAEALLDLPASSRLPLLLATEDTLQPPKKTQGTVSPGNIRRLICGALSDLPFGHWAQKEALEAAVHLRTLAADKLSPYANLNQVLNRSKITVKSTMKNLIPCLDSHQSDQDLWLRLPSDYENYSGQWFIQPDHEIIAPPEISPSDLCMLASVADLERADVAAMFHVSPASVSRAVESGLSEDDIIERLSSCASHALSEEMDLQIRDWIQQAISGTRRNLKSDEKAESYWALNSVSRDSSKTADREESSRDSGNILPPPHRSPPHLKAPKQARFGWGRNIEEFRNRTETRCKEIFTLKNKD